MKAKFGLFMTDGSGKVGGHVVSKNKGGTYVRTKVTPSNPQSTAQSGVRNRLTTFSQGWKSISESARAAWNSAVSNFAKTDIFGDIKNPSGINLFVKLNSNLDEVGVASLTNPPLPAAVEPVLTIGGTAKATPQTFEMVFTTTPVPANTALIVKATRQVSPGKSFLKNEFRNIAIFDAATISPEAIETMYISRFGALVIGQKIGISLTPVNKTTGQKGGTVRSTIIVIA